MRHKGFRILRIIPTLAVAMSAVLYAGAETRHWNPDRGHSPFSDSISSAAIYNCGHVSLRRLADVGVPASVFDFTFRARNLSNSPSGKAEFTDSIGRRHRVSNPAWRIVAAGTHGDGVALTLTTAEGGSDGISSRSVLRIDASLLSNIETPLASAEITDDIDPHTGFNSLRLERDNDDWMLLGGLHSLRPLIRFRAEGSDTKFIGFEADPGTRLEAGFITLRTPDTVPYCQTVGNDSGFIGTRLAESVDPMEGIWMVYDRQLEESRLRMGGDYRLAALADGKGSYDLVYMEGARTLASDWDPGMLKARLEATPLKNVWNVTWYDAARKPLARDVRAQYDPSTGLMTISFPYSSSVLRLIQPDSTEPR